MKIHRRAFLKTVGLATAGSTSGCCFTPRFSAHVLVNDVHTQLNPTCVRCVTPVRSLADLQGIIQHAHREHRPVTIAGGRHAAGGQQFGSEIELIDTRQLRRVLQFDPVAGTIDVETGTQWPEFMAFLRQARDGQPTSWSVAQKQTGTDRLSIGGALSSNAHGRCLTLPPFISNVESVTVVNATGETITCDRRQNSELFKLAIGGYGLFGFIYSARLRLVPLRKVRRHIELVHVAELPASVWDLVKKDFPYGDFQFAIDSRSEDFLNLGILTSYEAVADDTPVSTERKQLSEQDWKALVYLAHADPTRAFSVYAQKLTTLSGQVCDSDTQYVSDYYDNYHRELDVKLGSPQPGTEVLGEIYVPREALPAFFNDARAELRRPDAAPLIYGSVRFIEKDSESFLAWARESSGCVIFNFHTPHTPAGLQRTSNTFRRLIDCAIRYGGSYYLTYHRYATREQVLACYPQFPEFLKLKLKYDPQERFQSDWYRYYKRMFA